MFSSKAVNPNPVRVEYVIRFSQHTNINWLHNTLDFNSMLIGFWAVHLKDVYCSGSWGGGIADAVSSKSNSLPPNDNSVYVGIKEK